MVSKISEETRRLTENRENGNLTTTYSIFQNVRILYIVLKILGTLFSDNLPGNALKGQLVLVIMARLDFRVHLAS